MGTRRGWNRGCLDTWVSTARGQEHGSVSGRHDYAPILLVRVLIHNRIDAHRPPTSRHKHNRVRSILQARCPAQYLAELRLRRRRVRKLLHHIVEQNEVLAVIRLLRAHHPEPGAIERELACRPRDICRAKRGVHIRV